MKILKTNRRAKYDYELIFNIEAGLVLKNSMVKELNETSLQETYCYIKDDEMFIHNLFDEDIKLLLKKRELKKFNDSMIKGLTIIPLKLYLNDRNIAKLEISLAKGKKNYDKRNSIKEREFKRNTYKQDYA